MQISADVLQSVLQTWGYLAVFLVVAIEYAGIPLPGETMLITAAAYAGTGHLRIELVIGSAIAGGAIGSTVGFLIGRTGGRGLILRYARYVRLDDAKLRAGERFFARYGDWTVFFGRFVAIVRSFTAILAGLHRMTWGRFLVFNVAGAVCWSLLWGILAFYLGKNLALLHRLLSATGIAAVVLIVAIALFLLHRRRERFLQHRESDAGEDRPRDRRHSL